MQPRTKKALIGCGIGCGMLVLAVIVLVASFFAWVGRPGELLQPRQLLAADTVGYVEWTLRLEDPGTDGFAEALIEAIRQTPTGDGGMPPWLRDWLTSRRDKEAESDIRSFFPMVAAWTLYPGESPGLDLHLLTISLEQFGNRMVLGDWIIGFALGRSDEASVHRYNGEKIYQLPLGEGSVTTFFLRGNDIFVTSDLGTAQRTVDRLAREPGAAAAEGDFAPLFAETDGRGPLRGAMSNLRGEVGRLWRQYAATGDHDLDDAFLDGIRGVTLTGGLREDGSFSGRLDVLCSNADDADDNADRLATALRERFTWGELDPRFEANVSNDRIVVDLRLEDLAGMLRDSVEHGVELEEGTRIRIDP